jgi:formate hydrogenlyase subunit 3/multisubunit Na+/H+ antiporter MnhD subunit
MVLLGSALSFIYMFRTYQRSFWANTIEEKEASPSSRLLVVLILAGVVLFLGLWPESLLTATRLAVIGLTGELP